MLDLGHITSSKQVQNAVIQNCFRSGSDSQNLAEILTEMDDVLEHNVRNFHYFLIACGIFYFAVSLYNV
jgi:hypothetical protein